MPIGQGSALTPLGLRVRGLRWGYKGEGPWIECLKGGKGTYSIKLGKEGLEPSRLSQVNGF